MAKGLPSAAARKASRGLIRDFGEVEHLQVSRKGPADFVTASDLRVEKILRDELSGSTITITSLGPLGGIVTTPVINYPEVAIVGVNRIVERAVIRAGTVVPRRIMNLSSSFDHRVVDGARGAEFVQALRGFLEAPATLFID